MSIEGQVWHAFFTAEFTGCKTALVICHAIYMHTHRNSSVHKHATAHTNKCMGAWSSHISKSKPPTQEIIEHHSIIHQCHHGRHTISRIFSPGSLGTSALGLVGGLSLLASLLGSLLDRFLSSCLRIFLRRCLSSLGSPGSLGTPGPAGWLGCLLARLLCNLLDRLLSSCLNSILNIFFI